MEAPEPVSSTHSETAEAMLDHLIGLLVSPDDSTKAWLRSLAVQGTDKEKRSANVKTMIRLGATADVDQVLMNKVVVIMLGANQLSWAPESIEGWITAIYKDRQARLEHNWKLAQAGHRSE